MDYEGAIQSFERRSRPIPNPLPHFRTRLALRSKKVRPCHRHYHYNSFVEAHPPENWPKKLAAESSPANNSWLGRLARSGHTSLQREFDQLTEDNRRCVTKSKMAAYYLRTTGQSNPPAAAPSRGPQPAAIASVVRSPQAMFPGGLNSLPPLCSRKPLLPPIPRLSREHTP